LEIILAKLQGQWIAQRLAEEGAQSPA